MQGYILNTTALKNQDLIVSILTPKRILRLYRFYGVRHSIIHLGKKIDFEQESNGLFMPKLRNVMHLGHSWENDLDRTYVWQRFIKLLAKHLFDIYELDDFYFEMLQRGAIKLVRQNPLRVALEMYAELLGFEGREHRAQRCFVCGERLQEEIALGRAFLFGHKNCVGGRVFASSGVVEFLSKKSTLHLNDDEIEKMWEILLKGF